jgi:hypothetical protein
VTPVTVTARIGRSTGSYGPPKSFGSKLFDLILFEFKLF